MLLITASDLLDIKLPSGSVNSFVNI